MFDFNPQAQADQIRNAQTNPLTGADLAPGIFTRAYRAPVQAANEIIGQAAQLLGDAATPILMRPAKSVDSILGTDVAGFLEAERTKTREFTASVRADREAMGLAGQIVSQFGTVIAQTLATGPVGTAILQGYTESVVAQTKGVDRNTANLFGAIQGLATGVGVALPMSLGLKTGSDLLYAAAANAVPNLAARGASGALLEQAGYKEMAQQYRALDAEAIAADVILGVAFAGAGRVIQSLAERVKPSDVDAALTVKARTHLEIDSAPGVPRDPVSRDLHVQAITRAVDDLIAGRPVDVASLTADANFEPVSRGQVASVFDAEVKRIVDEAIAAQAATVRSADTPGFLRSAEDMVALRDETAPSPLSPEVARVVDVARKPGFQRTAEEKVLLDAVTGGRASDVLDGPKAIPEAPAAPADAAQAPAARPAEPTAAPTQAESPEVAAARQTLAELPELRVVDDDGNITTAADLMARADDAVTTARTESKAFDAAVNCLLRFGT